MWKVYGPYKRKDGRSVVILYDGNRRKTVSYPKYLLEQYLGRGLGEDETVHHADGNFDNNDLSNLKALPRKAHASLDVIRGKRVVAVCIWCGSEIVLDSGKDISQRNRSYRDGKAGPFCSKQCSGEYGALLQSGRCDRLFYENAIPTEYYRKRNME